MAEESPELVEPVVTPPSPVGGVIPFDAAQYVADRTLGNIPDIDTVEEDPLISQTREQISSLIRGELPQSVQGEITRRAAEVSNIGGISGPAARAFELRDLGRSSLEAIQSGIGLAGQVEELRLKRVGLNQAATLETAKLEEQARQANDAFALASTETNQNQQRITLAALEMKSRNRQFRISAENELIINNSRSAIDNVQQNIDSLAESFTSINDIVEQIAELGI